MAVFENKDLYPTPDSVIELMGINCKDKVVLEPQAGFGNIVDWLIKEGAKEVLTCEVEPSLTFNLQTKTTFMGFDFLRLKSEDIAHVNLIVMNPPFSNADKHILHAFQIAPSGCEIISLCNYETVRKGLRYREISALLKNNGSSSNLGQCFQYAERKTDVEVGLIKLHKPIDMAEGFDTSGFFMEEEEEEHQENGIMSYNSVRAIVNNYVGCIKEFEKIKLVQEQLNSNLGRLCNTAIDFTMYTNNGNKDVIKEVDQFAKELQFLSWKKIFYDMGIEKYVTTKVMEKINKFVQEQTKVPFTMKNVYHMLDVIYQTREETFKQSLEEAIDNFTRHTHENRYGVEGWKTNKGHLLNKKFICEGVCDAEYGYLRAKYNCYNGRKLDDLTKVLCNLNGVAFNHNNTLYISFSHTTDLETNTWYDWNFFKVKFFKKGTMHLKFKDESVWARLNQAYAKIKGFSLPDSL